MSKFSTVIQYVLINEGSSLSMDPNDSGNWTGGEVNSGELKGSKFGISAAAYPNVDIANMTQAQAEAIYHADYWNKINGDNLRIAFAFLLLDASVNSGISAAVKWAQLIVGEYQDGDCGPLTQAALNAYNQSELCKQYSVSHLMHYMSFSNWHLYAKGFTKRIIFDSMMAQRLLDTPV